MEEIKFIMRTVGEVDLSEYTSNIPNLEICRDTTRNAMDTFRKSLEMIGESASVNMEDDIILCKDFMEKIQKEIEKRPDDVIQFFSMRKDDLTIGSRYIPGRQFLMGQCFYLPKGMSKELLEYSKTWSRLKEHPTGLDTMIGDFLKEKKVKYWNVCPNLVDHKVCKSRIDPRRSSKRQSLTFKED